MYSPNYYVCLKKLYFTFANEKAPFQESNFEPDICYNKYSFVSIYNV